MVKMSAVDELEHLEARARAFVRQNKKLSACKVFIEARYSTAYALAAVNRMFDELPTYAEIQAELAAALARAQAAEGEAARLREVLTDALAMARTSLIPDTFEHFEAVQDTRALQWSDRMRASTAAMIADALK